MEEKINILENEIKLKDNKIKEITDKNEELEKNNFDINIKEEKFDDNNDDTNINKNNEYYTKFNKLKNEYNLLQDKYSSVSNEYKRNKEELLESKKNYKLLNDEKVKLKADILELKADFKMDKNQYEKKIANLEKQLSAKNNLLVEIKNNKETDNNNDLVIINLRKKNSEIQNENILLKEEIKQQSDELDELNEKIGEQNKKINQKINELAYSQRIIEELRKKIKEKEEYEMVALNIERNKNYDCVKCYQLTDKLKWYLLKKEDKDRTNIKNNKNIYTNCDINSFVWLTDDNLQNFSTEDKRNNFDIEVEKSPKILEGKTITKYSLNNIYKKDMNNEKLLDTVEKLKNENKYLNKIILKYKTELNVMDISNIKDEIDDSILTEDKCFEDILDDLDNNININNLNNFQNNNVNNIYNIHNNNNNMKIYLGSSKNRNNKNMYMLKDSIDSLMSQIKPSQNARGTLGFILKQLGCTDDEVIKLMDHHNYKSDMYKNK